MAKFTYDHIHLRSPDPEATARYYERMFGAEVIRTMQGGKPRIDLKLGGANIFIAPVASGKWRAPDGRCWLPSGDRHKPTPILHGSLLIAHQSQAFRAWYSSIEPRHGSIMPLLDLDAVGGPL